MLLLCRKGAKEGVQICEGECESNLEKIAGLHNAYLRLSWCYSKNVFLGTG